MKLLDIDLLKVEVKDIVITVWIMINIEDTKKIEEQEGEERKKEENEGEED